MKLIDVATQGLSRALELASETKPRFPLATLWTAAWASRALKSCRWIALPLGPLRYFLSAFIERKHRLVRTQAPPHLRLLTGFIEGSVNALLDGAPRPKWEKMSPEQALASLKEIQRRITPTVY